MKRDSAPLGDNGRTPSIDWEAEAKAGAGLVRPCPTSQETGSNASKNSSRRWPQKWRQL